MNKTFKRIVSLLMVAPLLSDPILASTYSNSSPQRSVVFHRIKNQISFALFQEAALSQALLTMEHQPEFSSHPLLAGLASHYNGFRNGNGSENGFHLHPSLLTVDHFEETVSLPTEPVPGMGIMERCMKAAKGDMGIFHYLLSAHYVTGRTDLLVLLAVGTAALLDLGFGSRLSPLMMGNIGFMSGGSAFIGLAAWCLKILTRSSAADGWPYSTPSDLFPLSGQDYEILQYRLSIGHKQDGMLLFFRDSGSNEISSIGVVSPQLPTELEMPTGLEMRRLHSGSHMWVVFIPASNAPENKDFYYRFKTLYQNDTKGYSTGDYKTAHYPGSHGSSSELFAVAQPYGDYPLFHYYDAQILNQDFEAYMDSADHLVDPSSHPWTVDSSNHPWRRAFSDIFSLRGGEADYFFGAHLSYLGHILETFWNRSVPENWKLPAWAMGSSKSPDAQRRTTFERLIFLHLQTILASYPEFKNIPIEERRQLFQYLDRMSVRVPEIVQHIDAGSRDICAFLIKAEEKSYFIVLDISREHPEPIQVSLADLRSALHFKDSSMILRLENWDGRGTDETLNGHYPFQGSALCQIDTFARRAVGANVYQESSPDEIIRSIFAQPDLESVDLAEYLERIVHDPASLIESLKSIAELTLGSELKMRVTIEALKELIHHDSDALDLLDRARYYLPSQESRVHFGRLMASAIRVPLSISDPGYVHLAEVFVEKYQQFKVDRSPGRKPFILAIKAAPAAGKTTLVHAMRHALEAVGVRVETVDERQFIGHHATYETLHALHPDVDVILFETVTNMPADHRLLNMYVELKADLATRLERILFKVGSVDFAQERAGIAPVSNYADRAPDAVIDNTSAGAAIYTEEEIAERMAPALRKLTLDLVDNSETGAPWSMWLIYGPIWFAVWIWTAVSSLHWPVRGVITQRARRGVPWVEEILFRGGVFAYFVLGAGGGDRLLDGAFWLSSPYQALAMLLIRIVGAAVLQAVVFAALHIGRDWWKGLETRLVAGLYLQYLVLTLRPHKALRLHAMNNKIFRNEPLSDAEWELRASLPRWVRTFLGGHLWQVPEGAPAVSTPKRDGIFTPIWYLRDELEHDWGKSSLRTLSEFILFNFLIRMQRVQVPPLTMSDYAPAPYSVLSTVLKEPTYINPDWLIDDVAELLPTDLASDLRHRYGIYKTEHASEIEAARNKQDTRLDKNKVKQTYSLSDEERATHLLNGLFTLVWDTIQELDDHSALKKSITQFKDRADNNNPELGSLMHHLLYLALKEKNMQANGRNGWDSRTWGELSDTRKADLEKAMRQNETALARHLFIQWAFDQQFSRVLDLAELLGITLADDEPYPVPKADAWLRPDVVFHGVEGGVSADQFGPLGQAWQAFILWWTGNRGAVEPYWKARFLHGLGRAMETEADVAGYEKAKELARERIREKMSAFVTSEDSPDIDSLTRDASQILRDLRQKYGIKERQGIMMRRKDHAYGAFRVYAYTNTTANLKELGLTGVMKQRVEAGAGDLKQRRKLAGDMLNDMGIAMRAHPQFRDHAASIFDESGHLRTSAMIMVSRPAEDEHPPEGWWNRRYSVQKAVETAEGPTVFDYGFITDLDPVWREKLNEQPLDRMMGYMWPADPAKGPRDSDEVLASFYDYNDGKFNDIEGPLTRLFQDVVNQGAMMVVELLGNPYEVAQAAVRRIRALNPGGEDVQLLQIIPVIYGLNPPDDYHVSRHGADSQVTAAIQDSDTLKEALAELFQKGELNALADRLGILSQPTGLFNNRLNELVAQVLLQYIFLSPASETMVGLFDFLRAMNHEGKPNDPNIKVSHPNWLIRMAVDQPVSHMIFAALGRPSALWAQELVNLIRFLQSHSGRGISTASFDQQRLEAA